MKRLTRSVAITAVTAMLVLGLIGTAAAVPASSTATNDTGEVDSSESGDINITAVEQYVHEAVNEERTADGADELEFDSELRNVAQEHSEDMADRGYFSHVDPDGNAFTDRYADAGYECSVNGYTGGENIAQTWYDTPVNTGDGTIVHYEDERELGYGIAEQWMNSPGHKENLLADHWENQGIGIHVTDTDQVFATQNFC
ncbi:CAP domain-containing protein [Halostagnicola kamekurae]|uniref:Uncharacterized conserved protein YkwD, contains CAP (CSP/antigen 5/PR1) domain n=1 Tax=Halostagnicola kamekurae TaxID=619731 RepID=A0A1I6RTR5_9EURY|nr:CAP domain-containing protein [Halostagnicola kamekurae]SFS68062.1 Uncharacterized conserved protein YkwD, contains CAP (CSP/antigen 5/PR1) domain [Halostagnicola kamekurae]